MQQVFIMRRDVVTLITANFSTVSSVLGSILDKVSINGHIIIGVGDNSTHTLNKFDNSSIIHNTCHYKPSKKNAS